MFNLDAVALGFLLILIGAGFILLTRFLARAVPQIRPAPGPAPQHSLPVQIPPNRDGLLVIESGGRVAFSNPQASAWFEIPPGELPDLEQLARRARPRETFLNLCAAEGHGRFSLGGIFLEGASFHIPHEGGRAVALTLRRPQLATSTEETPGVSGQALDIVTELSQAMTASLDLETTLEAVLDNVDRLVPSDFSEITLRDEVQANLQPYRFVSLSGGERQLEVTNERYAPGEGYSHYLLKQAKPLLIPQVEAFRDVQPAIDRRRFPLKSFLGVPLLIAGDPIGTLELASLSEGAFNENDLEVLRILSGQAAVAVRNAQIHQQEQQRVAELTGLANLAQATAALRDPQDLYERLIQAISPLLGAEILGLLIYDEPTRTLAGRVPFLGMPEQFVELYQTRIEPDSPGEKIWLRQEAILNLNAAEDARFEALGLAHLAQAAGIENALLLPLTASGRPLGYLQAANKVDGTLLNEDDQRLLAIIAGQLGPIIENANLVQESRRRVRQAEAMRRITSLSASGATLDEILKFSLQELARLIGAQVGAIFLLDSNHGELQLHQESLFGLTAGEIGDGHRLHVDNPQFRHTVTGSLRPFLSDDIGVDQRVLPLYRPLVDALGQFRSVIDVPLEVRETGIGEILLGNTTPGYFQMYDAQLASTAARQLASAIERSFLYAQTDEELRSRLDQQTAMARFHRELASSLDADHLVACLYSEALLISQADRAAAVLFPEPWSGDEMPAAWLQEGEPLTAGGQELSLEALQRGEMVVVEDFSSSELQPPASDIGAAVVLPLSHQNRMIGVAYLEYFSRRELPPQVRETLQALGEQAASALTNARRFAENQRHAESLERRVQVLDRLLVELHAVRAEETLEEALAPLAEAVRATTPFQVALFSVVEPESQVLRRVQALGIPEEVMEDLQGREHRWEQIWGLLLPEFAFGPAFLIPHDRRPGTAGDLHIARVLEGQAPGGQGHWHAGDLLLLPLVGAGGEPLGLISLDAPGDGRRPGPEAIPALEILRAQATSRIESYRQIGEIRSRMQALEAESSRTQKAAQTAQDQLPTLLQKDLQQTLAIRQLSERALRMRAGLDIAEIVNTQPDRSTVLWALGQEMLTRMNLNAALVADSGSGEPRLLHSLGMIKSDVNPQALFGQRNPLRQSLNTGETYLVHNLEEADDWRESAMLQALEARAFICLPIVTNGDVDAAVLAVSQVPLPPLSQEDRQVYNLLSSQVAITLQNLSLLTETRRRLREVGLLLDFSRQIGSLDPDEILGTLVRSTLQVLRHAHAGMVALWDDSRQLLVPGAAAGYTDNQLIREIHYRAGEALPGQVFSSGRPLHVKEVDFAEQYKLPSESLVRYREATGGRVPVSSLLVPLLAGEASLGILVLDNFNTPAAFSEDDQALVTSLTQQTALTLENARLYQDAEQRAAQLRSLTDLAAAITSSLQTGELIDSLLNQLAVVLPFDTATLWLREADTLTVQAVRGFEEAEQRVGLTVNVEDSQLLSEMVASGLPINVDNTHADARFPALVEHPHLSWLGIPLISKDQVMGVIALEKTEANFYSSQHVQLATTLAGQTTVALENARLFEESQRRAQELDQRTQRLDVLNRLAAELSTSLDPDYILAFTIRELRQALGATSVSALLFDERDEPVWQAADPEPEGALPRALPRIGLFDRLRESLGVFNTAEAREEAELQALAEYLEETGTRGLLILPVATGSDLHGLLFVHSGAPHRSLPAEVDLARTIANQAATAYQNARLFERTRRLTEDLEQRVAERTTELAREHRRTQTLLNIITELSASLDLEIIINRTLALINEVAGAEQSTILLVRPEEPTLQYRASRGFTTPPVEGGEMTWLKVDEGLAGWVIREQQAVLVHDLIQDPRWVQHEDRESEHRSAIAVPLLVGAEALGTLMLFHRDTNHFSPDLLDLIQATAKQIAVAINNAQLYLLIRDQAERLGSMLRAQQIEATRSRAILESVADGVLVTDANDVISLFNAAAARILGLEAEQVLDRSLEAFIGLFGRAAREWQETIRRWSENPASYEPGSTYAEQIELEDGKFVAVSLAPVILRDEMLGTVSIFRDITHQVEVDRLKSEFVATVSHELRTPMTSIKGYVDVLLMGAAGPLTDEQAEFLSVVNANTEKLNVLVDDLLDISRIEAGRVTLALQPLDLQDTIAEVVEDITQRAQEANKRMHFEVPAQAGLPRVVGDPDRVHQILFNLVDNAYNYTPDGGRVTIRLSKAGPSVRVEVRDNGIGIPAEDQDRIFERFYRGEDPLVLATAGTGLGLSIVRELVRMHGGEIWFESSGEPGEGSTFIFTLPAYKPGGEPG